MSLSSTVLRRLAVAMGNKAAADAIAAAIDSNGSGPAAVVAAFGATTNLPAAACDGDATPSATNVNAAIDAVAAVAETRLDAVEAKVNAILASLKSSGQMASS